MKKSSTTAFLLAFLVALLVLVAAVVFLARDNRVLEERKADLESEQAILATNNNQLSEDLAVRESALDTAETARSALANEIEGYISEVETLTTRVAEQEANTAEAEAAGNEPGIQLFIFAPRDGAVVIPKNEIQVLIGAFADDGVATIDVTVNGESRPTFQAEGQASPVLTFNWTPEMEATYTIEASSSDVNGQSSEAAITITAAYPSEEARQEAVRQEVEDGVTGLRLPESEVEPTPEAPAFQPVTQTITNTLHQYLLFGSESYSEAEAESDEIVYRAFRLIPDDFDLAAYAQNLSEQDILGAYNPETLAVVAYSAALSEELPFLRWQTAHSEMHNLQINIFGLEESEILNLPTDQRIAFRAMIEGEANFVQYNYLQNGEAFTPEEQVSVTDILNQGALALFNEAPPFLRAQFEFAYRSGFQFIQFLFDQGEFELVDNIWGNQPLSSEQILHPERYLAGDTPTVVNVPSLTDALDGDWQLVRQDTLGEFYLRQHLEQYLSPEELDTAALGWDGDQYIVYWDAANDELVMALRLAWDGQDDPAEFTTAYTNYLRRVYTTESQLQVDGGQCWEGEDVTCFYQFELQTFVVRAPDLETAAIVAAAAQPQ
jgi:hypothetical protein